MNTDTPERFDRSKPPPGYMIVSADSQCFRWITARAHGEPCENADQAIHLAWNRHEDEHYPPGMQVFVWPKEKASDPPTSWCIAPHGKRYVAERATEPEARAAAWAWYWRRVAVVTLAERAGCKVPAWPDVLALSDEAVARVERTFAAVADLKLLDQGLTP